MTASGNVFAKDENDWKWFHTSVPRKLENLHSEGYVHGSIRGILDQ